MPVNLDVAPLREDLHLAAQRASRVARRQLQGPEERLRRDEPQGMGSIPQPCQLRLHLPQPSAQLPPRLHQRGAQALGHGQHARQPPRTLRRGTTGGHRRGELLDEQVRAVVGLGDGLHRPMQPAQLHHRLGQALQQPIQARQLHAHHLG